LLHTQLLESLLLQAQLLKSQLLLSELLLSLFFQYLTLQSLLLLEPELLELDLFQPHVFLPHLLQLQFFFRHLLLLLEPALLKSQLFCAFQQHRLLPQTLLIIALCYADRFKGRCRLFDASAPFLRRHSFGEDLVPALGGTGSGRTFYLHSNQVRVFDWVSQLLNHLL